LVLFVIPGLTRNPVFLSWIPASAGMTATMIGANNLAIQESPWK
jgi:hypothetical protein